MFPFLLSSNENENHNENDSHFGPLRGITATLRVAGPSGRFHFDTPLSHSGFALWRGAYFKKNFTYTLWRA